MRDETRTTNDPDHWVRLAGERGDGSIERFELTAARRALKLLKTTLGREALLDLLSDEVAAGTAYLREQVEASAGEEATATTTLRAHGLGSAEFTAWLGRAFGREDVLLAAHPEHYAISAARGRVDVVETIGDHVCSFSMPEWGDPPRPEPRTARPGQGAALTRRSRMVLDDGTVVGSVTTSLRDEDGGFVGHLSVSLPATCGPDVVEHHLRHFAVELRNWILAAAAEREAPAEDVVPLASTA